MTDELLPYYERELAYFRQIAPEFALKHPRIAGRLRMSEAAIDDPHVERLIQAVAFLNARTRRKIDDEFPEISKALLQTLYPHYVAPFPSATIAQFALPLDQAELTQGFSIPRGAILDTDPIDGEPYRFRTCYPVTVLPLDVSRASVQQSAFPLPGARWKDRVRSRIRIELSTYGRRVPVGSMALDRLRFFVHAPRQFAYQLYEAIFNNSVGIAVSGDRSELAPVALERECLQFVGFEPNEALVEPPPRSFPAYALLSEYFVFPQKFLFFDVTGLTSGVVEPFASGSGLSIDICLDRTLDALERYVSAQTFQLGCAPIVNLFSQRAESIRLTQHAPEYRVIPDARRPRAFEVHSIDEVVAVSPASDVVRFSPFYSLSHHGDGLAQADRFWHATRRPDASGDIDRSDVFISLVDIHSSPSVERDWMLDVMTTCLNPRQLPFGGGQPRFRLESGGPLLPIACLVPPTRPCRPVDDDTTIWRLISHLTLNHLSLLHPDDAKPAWKRVSEQESPADRARIDSAEPLREILKLYDIADSNETQNLIAGVLAVSARWSTARPGGPSSVGVCRGLEVTVHFDEDRFTGSGLYLFGAVLERFFGMYCSINSFTRTIVTTNRRDDRVCRWPARAGDLVFL